MDQPFIQWVYETKPPCTKSLLFLLFFFRSYCFQCESPTAGFQYCCFSYPNRCGRHSAFRLVFPSILGLQVGGRYSFSFFLFCIIQQTSNLLCLGYVSKFGLFYYCGPDQTNSPRSCCSYLYLTSVIIVWKLLSIHYYYIVIFYLSQNKTKWLAIYRIN